MEIKSFEIEGYKNLRQKVALSGLGDRGVIVIHGLNNVGKTNLIEALQLPFALLGDGREEHDMLPFQRSFDLKLPRLERVGLVPDDWFTLGSPTPIRVLVSLQFEAEELRRRGVSQVFPCNEVSLEIVVEKGSVCPVWRITQYRFGDGTDVVVVPSGGATLAEKQYKFGIYFAREVLARRFLMVPLVRVLPGETSPRARGLLSSDLALLLYDARESQDAAIYRRWDAFTEACRRFDDILHGAVPVVTYDRIANRATLSMQSEAGRLPAHLLGTGVQQLLAILARMIVCDADVIAVEEPEASLSMGLHGRLRDALRAVTASGLGPRQVFMTSHSPQFNDADDFIAVTAPNGVPAVHWRSPREGPLFTEQGAAPPPGSSAPVSYVTEQGLVALPEFVRKQLGVLYGGGVVFWTHDKPVGHAEIVSDAEALAALAPEDHDAIANK